MRVHEGAGSRMVWETVPTNYYFFFFLSFRISGGFLFAVPNFTGGFMGLLNEEMKYETNVIALIT